MQGRECAASWPGSISGSSPPPPHRRPGPGPGHSPATPAFSFFLARPLGVFAICIFSAFSTSATELTPDSAFFSRSVLESPCREEEGCAHKCGGVGGRHPLLSEERGEASRLGGTQPGSPTPLRCQRNLFGTLGELLWEGNGRGT